MTKTNVIYACMLCAYTLLVLSVLLWIFAIDDENSRLGPFLIGMLPLMFLLRGLLHGRVKTCQFAIFVAFVYLVHGSVELIEDLSLPAFTETCAAFSLMTTAAFYIRWQRADTHESSIST